MSGGRLAERAKEKQYLSRIPKIESCLCVRDADLDGECLGWQTRKRIFVRPIVTNCKYEVVGFVAQPSESRPAFVHAGIADIDDPSLVDSG